MGSEILLTAAIVVGVIGTIAGGLGSLYCVVQPFRALRHGLSLMWRLWACAIFAVVMATIMISAMIANPGHGAFATIGVFYGSLSALLTLLARSSYKDSKEYDSLTHTAR